MVAITFWATAVANATARLNSRKTKWKLRRCCMGFPPETSLLGSGPDCPTLLTTIPRWQSHPCECQIGVAGAANVEHSECGRMVAPDGAKGKEFLPGVCLSRESRYPER